MITITNRKYETLCQLSFDLAGGLIAYDDWFEQDLDTGVGTYEFTVDKDGNPELEKIINGCYVFVMDGSQTRGFEIVSVEQDNDSKTFYCEDGGLDLLGETVWPLDGTSRTLREYFALASLDSGWEIGVNAVPNGSKRSIKTEGFETAVKRMRRIAKAFDVELSFSYEFVHGKVHRKLVNFHKRIGEDKKIRLEYGINVSKITKKESIEHLATALRGIGADDLTLAGFEFTDPNGRYILDSTGMLFDTLENERWKRVNAAQGGYIVDVYNSEAKEQKTLFDETFRQLKKRAYPESTYEVDITLLPEGTSIGDSASIVDNEYQPAIQIEARIAKLRKQLSQPNVGKVTITNVVENPDTISDRVQRLSTLVKERLFDFTEVPFIMQIQSTEGVVFQNNNIATKLIAGVSKMDIPMNSRFSYRWKRVSKYGTDDAAWNEQHKNGSNELSITVNDVDREATFICEAIEGNQVATSSSIVIKDFIVNKSIGPTPPANPSAGDLWTDTSTQGKDVPKIYTNGKWEPVLKKDDAELKRLQQEFESRNREQASQFAEVMEIINKNEVNNDTLRDLTGKFSNMEETYNRIMATADEIKGLGQRTKAVELNLEQSQLLINTLASNFSLSEDGFLIGKNGSKLQIKTTNERMEFIDSGRVVAFVSGQTMNIVSATFWNSVTIANHIFERFNDEFTTISYVGGALIGKNI
jgi:phage minor structural protein, N-terminal domain protein|nr:MAG TPA: tail protein [Caudoviricetes sp.]